MAFTIGIIVALAVVALTAAVGLDRDRALYPVMLIVVASYYVLFAVMGGSTSAIVTEIGVMAVFVILAVVGFKTTLWVVAAGLVGHGLMDMVHGRLITNPGVPEFWPGFCAGFDVAAGFLAAWLMSRNRFRVRLSADTT